MKRKNTKEKKEMASYFDCKNSDEIISMMDKSGKEHKSAMFDAIEIEIAVIESIKKQD